MPAAIPSQASWLHRPLRTPAALVLIGLCATSLGYHAGLHHNSPPLTLRLNELPDASEFARCDTFSEIGMQRARLRGLCQRALHELQVATLRERRIAQHPKEPSHGIVEALTELVSELRQTPEEEPALRILLLRLSQAKAHDRWLDLYLEFVRRNPTASLAVDLQAEADGIATKCGRETQMCRLRALRDRWISAPQPHHPVP